MTDAAVPAPAIVRAAETTPGTAAAAPWAIRFTNIGKKYRLGATGRRQLNDNFRDALSAVFKGFVRAPLAPHRADPSEFWALRDINLEIARGDTVGIIGRNGAGKSTLLKILSRITAPTTGDIRYRGRLASLLEVGTGFHRELTGRENVYLNGSIIGMKRAEITRQFDAIVEFAALEKFIDTPVKFYSSGMYVRLAFAVAAHLRTDILVVDEVLAVGDAVFQKKCLGKMQDAATDGRTVLFVSHNMDAVQRLCRLCVLLKEGIVYTQGPVGDVIHEYESIADLSAIMEDRGVRDEAEMRLRTVRILSEDGRVLSVVPRGHPAFVEVRYDIGQKLSGVHIVCHFFDEQDRLVISTGDCDVSRTLHRERTPGHYKALFPLPADLLNEGRYSLTFALGVPWGQNFDRVAQSVSFAIVDSDVEKRPEYLQRRPGIVLRDITWSQDRIGNHGAPSTNG